MNIRRMSVLLFVIVAGCAQQPPLPAPGYEVGGRRNLGGGQITVFINGEQVAHGPLWMREPLRPFGFGGSRPEPFPLRGSYRGLPVEVECDRQPIVGDPICYVSLDGRLIGELMFDSEGLAGVVPGDTQ